MLALYSGIELAAAAATTTTEQNLAHIGGVVSLDGSNVQNLAVDRSVFENLPAPVKVLHFMFTAFDPNMKLTSRLSEQLPQPRITTPVNGGRYNRSNEPRPRGMVAAVGTDRDMDKGGRRQGFGKGRSRIAVDRCAQRDLQRSAEGTNPSYVYQVTLRR